MSDLRETIGFYELLGAIGAYVWSYCMFDWTGVITLTLILLALLIVG